MASSMTWSMSRTQTSVRAKWKLLEWARFCSSGRSFKSKFCWSYGLMGRIKVRSHPSGGSSRGAPTLTEARIAGIVETEPRRSTVAEQARGEGVDARPRERFLHAEFEIATRGGVSQVEHHRAGDS